MGDADLAWDHSAGERLMGADPNGSVRLDDSSVLDVLLHDDEEVNVDSGEHIRLSSNQLRYVLRGLEDAAALLRERQRTARRPRSSGGAHQQAEATSDGRLPHTTACCCWPTPLRCPRATPSALQRHVLAITCALQVVMLLSVCVIEAVNTNANPLSSQLVLAESVLMMTIAPLSLLLNVVTAGQLVCQLFKHEISIGLLVSSYLGFVISFGGLYAAIFQVKDDSWRMQVPADLPIVIAEVYCRMLYLAVCTSSLSSPSAILPQQWYTYLLLSIQMLLGVVYFAAAVFHLFATTLKQKQRLDGIYDADTAGLHRLPPPLTGRRSRAASETSLLSRELLRSVSGYGTMPNS